jgi:hypothetical protein
MRDVLTAAILTAYLAVSPGPASLQTLFDHLKCHMVRDPLRLEARPTCEPSSRSSRTRIEDHRVIRKLLAHVRAECERHVFYVIDLKPSLEQFEHTDLMLWRTDGHTNAR